MKREQAIKVLLDKIKLDILFKVTGDLAAKEPRNFALLLLKSNLAINDTEQNWFTALAVLCIHQRSRAEKLLQNANVQSGNKLLTLAEKVNLVSTIIIGAKITKADAGRGL